MFSAQTRQISLHPNSKKIQKLSSPENANKAHVNSSHGKTVKQTQEYKLSQRQIVILQLKQILSNKLEKNCSLEDIINELELTDNMALCELFSKVRISLESVKDMEQLNIFRKNFIHWIKKGEESERRKREVYSSKGFDNFKLKLNKFLETFPSFSSDQLKFGISQLLRECHIPANTNIENLLSSVYTNSTNPYLNKFYESIVDTCININKCQQLGAPHEKSSHKGEFVKDIQSNDFEGMELGETHKIYVENYAVMSFDWNKEDFN